MLTYTEFITLPKDCRRRLYYVIEMPLNQDGHGPAEYHDCHKITYEVWDQYLTSFGSYEYLPDAINACEELNQAWIKEENNGK